MQRKHFFLSMHAHVAHPMHVGKEGPICCAHAHPLSSPSPRAPRFRWATPSPSSPTLVPLEGTDRGEEGWPDSLRELAAVSAIEQGRGGAWSEFAGGLHGRMREGRVEGNNEVVASGRVSLGQWEVVETVTVHSWKPRVTADQSGVARRRGDETE